MHYLNRRHPHDAEAFGQQCKDCTSFKRRDAQRSGHEHSERKLDGISTSTIQLQVLQIYKSNVHFHILLIMTQGERAVATVLFEGQTDFRKFEESFDLGVPGQGSTLDTVRICSHPPR